MELDLALNAIENQILKRQLAPIERFVFQASWAGNTYDDMAERCSYGSDYIKEIGAHLWQELSQAMGLRVSKKNLNIVFANYAAPAGAPSLVKPIAPLPQLPNPSRHDISFPSGALPFNSPLYIERPPVEQLVLSELTQPGALIRIRAPQKRGKTSLLNRLRAIAQTQGYQVVYLNFQEMDETHWHCLDKLLRWLAANISHQLNLPPRLDDFWDADMGSKISCKAYLEGYILHKLTQPLVLMLDEMNCVFDYPELCRDFLPMLRAWHEQAKQTALWQKLHLVLAYATESHIPLKLHQSPFNVGLAVTLPLLTLAQMQQLAHAYGLHWDAQSDRGQKLLALFELLGGHPYLVSLTLYTLSQQNLDPAEILAHATTPTGIYGHHLRSHLSTLRHWPTLAACFRDVLAAVEPLPIHDPIMVYQLESMGLVELENNTVRPTCALYRDYFSRYLDEPPHELTVQAG